MKRWLYFPYGVTCHALFFGTFAYMAGFDGNVLAPKTIDTPTEGVVRSAIAINLLLLGFSAAQHLIMTRPAFRRIWTRIVPEPTERSTYVLTACVITHALIWQWRGIDTVVWEAFQPAREFEARTPLADSEACYV